MVLKNGAQMLLVLVLLFIGAGMSVPVQAEEQAALPRPHRCIGTVSLTFDDGPHPDLTPVLLDLLNELDIEATFFVVGERIAGNEAIIQRMVAEGHSVQNHTWNHPNLTELSDDEIKEQLESTSRAIVAAGAPEPVYFRPPFGAYDQRVTDVVTEAGMSLVTWTNALDTRDWEGISAEEIEARVLANLRSGGVVLVHDIQPNTVASMPSLINAIHSHGYCINPYRGEEFWVLDA